MEVEDWDFLKLNKFSLGIWPYLPIQRPEPRHINFNFGRGIHEHFNYAFSFSQKQMKEYTSFPKNRRFIDLQHSSLSEEL